MKIELKNFMIFLNCVNVRLFFHFRASLLWILSSLIDSQICMFCITCAFSRRRAKDVTKNFQWVGGWILWLFVIYNVFSRIHSKPINIRLIRTGSHQYEKLFLASFVQFSTKIKMYNLKAMAKKPV